jgi:hypothetical protein
MTKPTEENTAVLPDWVHKSHVMIPIKNPDAYLCAPCGISTDSIYADRLKTECDDGHDE